MPIIENPIMVAECSTHRNSIESSCLNFIRDVTLVIACQAETEYNVRHSKNMINVFSNDDINTTREKLIQQATTRLLKQFIVTKDKPYKRMMVTEKTISHNCSCIFTKLGDFAMYILEEHPHTCCVNYMGDVDKTRKHVYESIMVKYKKFFLADDKLINSIWSSFLHAHTNGTCSDHMSIKQIAENFANSKN